MLYFSSIVVNSKSCSEDTSSGIDVASVGLKYLFNIVANCSFVILAPLFSACCPNMSVCAFSIICAFSVSVLASTAFWSILLFPR